MEDCEIEKELEGLDLLDQMMWLEQKEYEVKKEAQKDIVTLGACLYEIQRFRDAIRLKLQENGELD